jgi:3-hydroxyisobutyrate dehydrogenase-like beta-hydroxyacid dehydrogenase
MADKLKIGFIGLGKMGNPMARNLIKEGYPLTVYDIVKARVDELVILGARAADSPMSLARHAEVIIAMILDDSVLETVTVGEHGAFCGTVPGTVFINMSTVSPNASNSAAEKARKNGIYYLQAPVVGSVPHATAGTLTIFVSGSKEAYDKCLGIFNVLGQKSFYLGAASESLYLKLLINMMLGITAAMAAEAFTFGERGGLNWEQMIEIVSNSLVGSPVFGYKKALFINRDYSPAFTVAQMAKDFDIALDAGKSLSTPMPITSLVRQFFAGMQAREKGELDYFSLVGWMDELSRALK